MKFLKVFFVALVFFAIFITTLILHDIGIFYFATSDDKLYGDENKYIDPTLSGDNLTAQSNIRDSYKHQEDIEKFGLIGLSFLQQVLLFFIVIFIPILLITLAINKRSSIIEWFKDTFGID